ncbi:MAG: hypothetical protein ACE5GW_13790, partial [Planctomycetota bacterium]
LENEVGAEDSTEPDLEEIVLRPERGRGEPIVIPLDPARVTAGEGLRGSYRADDLLLDTGTWRVEPARKGIRLEVFDNCRELADAFERSGGDPAALLACLEGERPPTEVLLAGADLFFDRGLFEEARRIYHLRRELRSRFRELFIEVYIEGRRDPRLPIEEWERSGPYGIAATRLGWAEGEARAFGPGVELPWELEFVRGATAADAAGAAAGFEDAIESKRTASAGLEQMEFTPAHVGLARASLALAANRIGDLQIPEAATLLGDRIIGEDDLWRFLDAEERARALFWHGHIRLWYRGDEAGAIEALARGAAAGGGDLAGWCRLYLAGLDRGVDAGEEPPVEGWEPAFLELFRFHREIAREPNYNLLTERSDLNAYLSADERRRSGELHEALRALEEVSSPADPLAHLVVLYSLRNAQHVSWPAQEGGRKALEHRAQLLALPAPAAVAPLLAYHQLAGEVSPLDRSQLVVLPEHEREALLERIRGFEGKELPASFQEKLKSLERRLQAATSIGSAK